MAKHISIAKKILFSLLPTLVLFGIGEWFAHMAIDRSTRTVTNPETGGSTYEMHIGTFPWSWHSLTPLNTRGCPGPAITERDASDQGVTILIAGDSFVFGDGVDYDSSLVPRLQREFDKNAETTKIFNVAQRKTSIQQQTVQIREALPVLKPQLVLLGQYQNDLTDLTNPEIKAGGSAKGIWRTVLDSRMRIFNLAMVKYVTYHLFEFFIERRIEYDLLSQWSVLEDPAHDGLAAELQSQYASRFSELAASLQAANVRFGVFFIPSKFDLMARRSPEQSFFENLARQHAVPFLSLLPSLDKQRSPNPFLTYDGHFSEAGHRVACQAISNWLATTWQLQTTRRPPFRNAGVTKSGATPAEATTHDSFHISNKENGRR